MTEFFDGKNWVPLQTDSQRFHSSNAKPGYFHPPAVPAYESAATLARRLLAVNHERKRYV